MIQRIQTIYLLVATIVLGLLFIPLSIGTSAPATNGVFADGILNTYDNMGLTALNALPALDFLIAVFLFANRKLQMIVTSIGTLFSSMVGGVYAYLVMTNAAQIAIGAAMPLIALLCGYLAFRNIKKDEEIVRSADRLR
jgi:Domain of unknown function (DUF4293)